MNIGISLRVAKTTDLSAGAGKVVEAGGRSIAVFNVEGEYFAIDNECPHAGGSLGEGTLNGNVVTCPWHGAEFDVTCGKVLCPPARRDVTAYRVIVVGDDLLIEVDDI